MPMHNRYGLGVLFFIFGCLFIGMKAEAIETGEVRYKCHVQVNEKYEEIHWFIFKNTNKNSVQKKILGNGFFARDGRSRLVISHVFECVKDGQTFAQLRARKLEAQTVF